jgi:hypothetical protein
MTKIQKCVANLVTLVDSPASEACKLKAVIDSVNIVAEDQCSENLTPKIRERLGMLLKALAEEAVANSNAARYFDRAIDVVNAKLSKLDAPASTLQTLIRSN